MAGEEIFKGTISIVGGGIAGSMCALFAQREGYKVTLVAKGADPRISKIADPYSSTFGGEDSRYVTLTEGHPYLGTANYVDQMYPDMQGAFMRSIHEGGWLSQEFENYSLQEREWLNKRFKANEDQEQITRLFDEYVSENRFSMELWKELFSSSPHLTEGISLNNSGILRLYGNKDLFEMAKDFHQAHGVLVKALSAKELSIQFPVHAESVQCGFVHGALIVDGLTFQVQTLVNNILNELEENGARLRFDCEVKKVFKNSRGEVTGLGLTGEGKIQSDHYSLHLGAYDSAGLMEDVDPEADICGVAGAWLILPKPKGPFLPLKVHDGQHEVGGKLMPVVDLNINPARNAREEEILIIGGGYLFVGKAPFTIPSAARELMLSEIHRVTELTLGSAYREAKESGQIFSSEKICVRSFTPADNELNSTIPTASGGVMTIGGGGNTGVTAKAAWVARELLATLERYRVGEN